MTYRVILRYVSGPLCGSDSHQVDAPDAAAACAKVRDAFAAANPTVTIRDVSAVSLERYLR